MATIDLINFLHPNNINKEWREWKEDAPVGFVEVTHFDESKGEVKGFEYNSAINNLEEKAYNFDDYLLRKLNDHIITTVNEIRERKLNLNYSTAVLSDNQFNKTILNLIGELNSKYNSLLKNKVAIPKTMEMLHAFTTVHLKNQLFNIRNSKKKSQQKFEGSKLIIKSAGKDFLPELFSWLLANRMTDESDRSKFIDFFEGKWDMVSTVKWKGTAKEFVMFHYALYNPIVDLEPDDNIIFAPKRNYTYMLSFFIVEFNGNRLYKMKQALNSNTKKGSFYNKLKSKILQLT